MWMNFSLKSIDSALKEFQMVLGLMNKFSIQIIQVLGAVPVELHAGSIHKATVKKSSVSRLETLATRL